MRTSNNRFNEKRSSHNKVIINGVEIELLGEDNLKFGNNIYELTPQLKKAVTQTKYNFFNMSDDDILSVSKFLNDINYNPNTDRKSRRRENIRTNFIDRVQNTVNPPAASASGEKDENESIESDLEGKETKLIFMPPDHIEMWNELYVLNGLKRSGHTDTLMSASQLPDELYKRSEIVTEQQYRNAIEKIEQITQQINF